MERTTCSESVRDAILGAYPQAEDDAVLLRALVYLLFTPVRTDDGRRLFGTATLEWIVGEKIHHSSTRAEAYRTGESVIEMLRGRLLPDLEVRDHVIDLVDTGRANRRGKKVLSPTRESLPRTVGEDGIAPDLQSAVEADLREGVYRSESRVVLLTGHKHSPRKAKESREADQQGAIWSGRAAPSGTSRYILDTMNRRPPNGFAKLLAYVSDAHAVLDGWEVDRKPRQSAEEHAHRCMEVREGFRRVLRCVEDQPQPFYAPSARARTDRVFPYNPSILSIPTDARRAMTDPAGWVDLDLTGAHLAISATLWGVDSVRAFLEAGGSAWDDMLDGLGLDHVRADRDLYADVKQALKVGTYSAVYGMQEASIKGGFTKRMKTAGLDLTGQDFASHWIVRDLIDARGAQLETVLLEGGATTPTGIVAELDASRRIDEKSVLATVAQSYEAVLMEPVLRYEDEHLEMLEPGQSADFRVMVWQHDGCSVKFWRRKETHVAELKRRVAAVAEVHEIPTSLEEK